MFGDLVAERGEVEVLEEMFARAQECRADDQMEMVDEAGGEILADGVGAAAQADVFGARRVGGELKGFVDAAGDEVEGGAAFHDQGWTRVMGEHKDRCVEGWVGSPLASPGIVGPWAP